jgi:hypothetical protein
MALPIPAPTNKIPRATGSTGAPPLPGSVPAPARGLDDTPEDVSVDEGVALALSVELAVALGLEVALEVGVVVAGGVAVAMAVAVVGASGGDLGGGSTIEEVVSPMVVFGCVASTRVEGCVASTRVEGCVRSICVSGLLLPSNDLFSHCIPVTKAVSKATIAASTSTACNSPKKYLPPEYGLKTTRSA